MRKALFLILALLFFVLPVFAQFDAGFLDSPGNVSNPAAFTGTGWYCIDHQPWPAQPYILAGPFPTQPDCNGY